MLLAVGVQGRQKGADLVHAEKVPYGTEQRKAQFVPNGPLHEKVAAVTIRAEMTDFRDALLWHMNRDGTTIADLARGARVSIDVIKKVRSRHGASTNAEAAAKIAAYYGKSVSDFLQCKEVTDEGAFEALVQLLTPEERKMLVAQMRGMIQAHEEPKD